MKWKREMVHRYGVFCKCIWQSWWIAEVWRYVQAKVSRWRMALKTWQVGCIWKWARQTMVGGWAVKMEQTKMVAIGSMLLDVGNDLLHAAR